ncbi:HXXEE domain-containing protein [Legionella sp. W05-934-2]|jgi:hypothetical protein|uniref:HXXEE domain-containing protein n=1 Tax=Legionella sp. W05-934-2 TaxID=1198649 RepID=UPI003462C1BE
MKAYLYSHWADSCLFMALALTVMLLSYLPITPLVLFLIWFQFPVYLVHQFEEHFYPGHFREFINKEIFNSPYPDSPLTPSAVFWINTIVIWCLFPLCAVLAQNISLSFGILLPVFGLFNATLHIIMFVVKKRYNPGLIVSAFVNYPTGIYTLWVLAAEGVMTTTNVSIALLVTIILHLLIIIMVKFPRANLSKDVEKADPVA